MILKKNILQSHEIHPRIMVEISNLLDYFSRMKKNNTYISFSFPKALSNLFLLLGLNNFFKKSILAKVRTFVRFYPIVCALVMMLFVDTTAYASSEQKYIIKLKNKDFRLMSLFQNSISKKSPEVLSQDLGLITIRTNLVIDGKALAQSEFFKDAVEYIEPVVYVKHFVLPTDPLFNTQWGLRNDGGPDDAGHIGIPGIDINAEKAWDIETGSKRTIVAVIDTGVNYLHPDLQQNIWTNFKEYIGISGIDDDRNGYIDDIHGWNFDLNNNDPMDENGHGTHCAGIIGSHANNGIGTVGVNWNVSIMPIRFLNASGAGSSDAAIKAILYAANNGAHISSNSWGGFGSSDAMNEAIAFANSKGSLFVAAAGNESNDNDWQSVYPASYNQPNIISVGAIDNAGEPTWFTNWGKQKVHVSAPGMKIKSTYLLDGYKVLSGTSMATPYVAGIAALLKSHEPNLTHLEIRERILNTAIPYGPLTDKNRMDGYVSAYTALKNIRVPVELTQPKRWPHIQYILESLHPYEDNKTYTFEIKAPSDVKQFSILFDRLDLERGRDFVILYDQGGNEIQRFSDYKKTDFYSVIINGNYAKIVLTSDQSIPRDGIYISQLAVLK